MASMFVQNGANNGDAPENEYVLRMATSEDSSAIIEFQNRLGHEEDFLLVTPIDPVTGSALLKASLGKAEAPGPSCVFVADYKGQIIGLVLCRDHKHPFLKGMVQLSLCIDKDHRRRGIGSSLLFKACEWAKETGIRRLQLAVIADNGAALATYRKAGFEIEGTLINAAVIQGTVFNIHIMGWRVC